jgi:hypothetical protein
MLSYQRVYRLQGAFSYTQKRLKFSNPSPSRSLLIVAWAFLFRGGFAFSEFSYSRAVFSVRFRFSLANISRLFISRCVASDAFSAARHQSDSDFNRRHKPRSRTDDQRVKQRPIGLPRIGRYGGESTNYELRMTNYG